MPHTLPASGAHFLYIAAALIVINVSCRVWASNHPDSAFAQALAYAI